MDKKVQEFEKFDESILKILNLSNVISVARVGSSLTNKNCKDIDYLILVNFNNKRVEDILIKEFQDVSKVDDSYRIKLDGFICNLAVYEKNVFKKFIENIISTEIYGEHREWVYGYWIPEGLIFDILDSKITD